MTIDDRDKPENYESLEEFSMRNKVLSPIADGGIPEPEEAKEKFVLPVSIGHALHATDKAVRCTLITESGEELKSEILVAGAVMALRISEKTRIVLDIEE